MAVLQTFYSTTSGHLFLARVKRFSCPICRSTFSHKLFAQSRYEKVFYVHINSVCMAYLRVKKTELWNVFCDDSFAARNILKSWVRLAKGFEDAGSNPVFYFHSLPLEIVWPIWLTNLHNKSHETIEFVNCFLPQMRASISMGTCDVIVHSRCCKTMIFKMLHLETTWPRHSGNLRDTSGNVNKYVEFITNLR